MLDRVVTCCDGLGLALILAACCTQAPPAASGNFTAHGNEPFWTFQIVGDEATYKSPERLEGVTVPVTRADDAGWIRFSGALEGKPFVLSLTEKPCEDDMSGEPFPMTAELKRDGRVHRGCARPE